MKVTLEHSGGCRRIMGVDVPADRVKDDYDGVVRAYTAQARIPGFRKGKAPSHVVEKRFARNIEQDAKDRLVPMFYKEAVEKEGVDIAAVLDVNDVSFAKDDGLRFRVVLDLVPEFKLPKYKKIALRRQPVKVSDEDVERTLTEIRERFARFEDVEGRPVKSGDLVQIDYTGTCEGRPIADLATDCRDLGEGEDFWVPTEESEFLPGFNSGLEGRSAGDSFQIDVTFPEDYRTVELRGKSAAYDVEIKAIKSKALPEIDEEFLKHFEADSEQELRDRLRGDMEEAGESKEKARLKDEIADVLLSKVSIEPPQSLVERETEAIARNMAGAAARQGVSKEQLHQRRQQILSSAGEAANRRVKLSYLAARIADAEEIQVSDDDFRERLESMAQRYGLSAPQLKAEMEKRDALDDLRNDVRAEKVFEFLLENAKIKG